jgi:hypothetical protein
LDDVFSIRLGSIISFTGLTFRAIQSCVFARIPDQILQIKNTPEPSASIIGPTKLSRCDDLILDGSDSESGYLSYSWNNTIMTKALQSYFSSLASTTNIISIPNSLIPFGSSTFILTVTEIISGLSSSSNITVLKDTYENPNLLIQCPSRLIRNVDNSISSSLFLPNCSNTQKVVSYNWIILNGGSNIYIPSTLSSGTLYLLSNLVNNFRYNVQLNAVIKDVNGNFLGNSSATCSFLAVDPDPLALISSDNSYLYNPNSKLVIDASTSNPSGGTFSWSCCTQTSKECNTIDCLNKFNISTFNGPILTIDQNLPAGIFQFSVTYSKNQKMSADLATINISPIVADVKITKTNVQCGSIILTASDPTGKNPTWSVLSGSTRLPVTTGYVLSIPIGNINTDSIIQYSSTSYSGLSISILKPAKPIINSISLRSLRLVPITTLDPSQTYIFSVDSYVSTTKVRFVYQYIDSNNILGYSLQSTLQSTQISSILSPKVKAKEKYKFQVEVIPEDDGTDRQFCSTVRAMNIDVLPFSSSSTPESYTSVNYILKLGL